MKRDFALKILFLISALLLLGNALLIRRDYQDSWVLEGLEIPFLIFVLIFAVTFFSEKKLTSLVAIAIVARIVFLLIPNLKYVWFQGVYLDQNVQYSMANYAVTTGSIAPSSFSAAYSASPLFHLLFSMFSIVLNVSVADAMKYIPVLFSPLYPLLTYGIVKKLELKQEKTVLRFSLFLSAIPISNEQYEITGTMFGILLVLVILFLLVSLLKKNDRRYWIVSIVLVIALAAAHSVTSVILSVLLISILIIQNVSFLRIKSVIRPLIVLTVAIISISWLVFQGFSTFESISQNLFISVPAGTTPSSEYIPSTFFNLLHVNILAAAQTFMVYYGADLLFLILTLVGLLMMIRNRRKLNRIGVLLVLFGSVAFAIMVLGLFLKLGTTRTLSFERLLFPIFSGITISYVSVGNKRKWVVPLILSFVMLAATVQLYNCQPLIPSANILDKELPSGIPVGYVNDVVSVYQRQVVDFVLNHPVVGRIASDLSTYNLILGLSDPNYLLLHAVNYYPLDTNRSQQEYDLFIIHTPGKAGELQEKAEFRTQDLIFQTIYNSSVVYSNGESFVLAHHYP